MKNLGTVLILALLLEVDVFSQSRQGLTHVRGMLHQTVYNTGELGRAFDGGQTSMTAGFSSMEWPPNSRTALDGMLYEGQHNSMGGGLYLAGTIDSSRQTVACGAVATAGSGMTVSVEGVYSYPVSITRTENYPLLSDGELNLSYNPNEAEEIIVATWMTPMNISVTRTSRSWSYPGYDSFIIYEYDLVSTNSVPVTDAFVGWGYGFCPSMFGYERLYYEWSESNDMRSKDMYARFDLKRWMSYNHERTGKPDATYFDLWSQPGDRGGLDSPQAVGFLPLYYDHDHLAVKGHTNYPLGSDSAYVWDETGRIKQPYTNRYENRNLDITKITTWMDIISRKTLAFGGPVDSASFYPANAKDWPYWKGRAKPSSNLGWKQPVVHGYIFGPYTIPPNEHLHFSIAEVVGYGPGIASDSVYSDMGGGTEASGNVFHPVPSWYNEMNYASAGGTPPVIGSTYLQNHQLPWYVTPGVVSIRDVADRAIQMYTGLPLVKYDSVQFQPEKTPATGNYSTIAVPFPAPAISVLTRINPDSTTPYNEISWSNRVENFSSLRLKYVFSHYLLYRSTSALGPWSLIDSVSQIDPRFFKNPSYFVRDDSVHYYETYFYAVVSVDHEGGRSGMTNIIGHGTVITGVHETAGQTPYRFALEQNYPNPFNPETNIRFTVADARYVSLKVSDLLGREVASLVNEILPSGTYVVRWNASAMPSGVYLCRLTSGSFRGTKKLLLLK